MQYKIITDDGYHELTDTINILIMKGWKPIGGIACVTEINGDLLFLQAVIKEN